MTSGKAFRRSFFLISVTRSICQGTYSYNIRSDNEGPLMGKRYFGHIEVPLKRIHIELTNICDFNCVFCPKSAMERPYGYMDTKLAKRIIEEIRENKLCDKITFHVMGEPTLHPDFFEILSYAHDKGAKVGLTTNGSRLGGETGKRLLDYNLHQIDISLQTTHAKSFLPRKTNAL